MSEDTRAPGRRRTVRISAPSCYDVVIGAGVVDDLGALTAPHDRVVVLADEAVWRLHGARLGRLALPEPRGGAPRFECPGTEGSKSLATLGAVLEFLAASGCSRRSCLVAFGGGTISDLGGLAASLFKRGMDVVQVPTTLLAQVDASVGGKTGVNLAAGKNLVGTFHQPRAVLADSDLLATLPETEWRSGLAEIAKAALIAGEDELAALERDAEALAARDPRATTGAIAAAVALKARIVAADPFERDGRRALNLGHTFGHALEHAAGYGVIPHGEAVSVGITLALRASARLGLLEDLGLSARYDALAERLGLAREVSALVARYGAALSPAALCAGLAHDKKGAVGAPEFVLPRKVGALALGVSVPAKALDEVWGAA